MADRDDFEHWLDEYHEFFASMMGDGFTAQDSRDMGNIDDELRPYFDAGESAFNIADQEYDDMCRSS